MRFANTSSTSSAPPPVSQSAIFADGFCIDDRPGCSGSQNIVPASFASRVRGPDVRYRKSASAVAATSDAPGLMRATMRSHADRSVVHSSGSWPWNSGVATCSGSHMSTAPSPSPLKPSAATPTTVYRTLPTKSVLPNTSAAPPIAFCQYR